MKGKALWVSACVICLGIALVFVLTGCGSVDIDNGETGIARYVYGGKNVNAEIAAEDMEVITDILNGKPVNNYGFSSPSCGFDEDISVIIGEKNFCIARDSCGTLLYKGKGYIELDTEENEALRTVLEKYGFSWPCI